MENSDIELRRNAVLEGNSPKVSVGRGFANHDEAILARFGKKQQLKRGFGLLPVIALTSTLMITWEAITATLYNGLLNGGPAGLVYSYIFVWIGVGFQTLVMAELASMIPLAGGPFNWVAILSPAWCQKFLSYLAGWLTVIAWQALVAGTCYVSGTLIQGMLILNYPTYVYETWQGTLLFYAVLAFALFVNTYLGQRLPQLEPVMLIVHVFGYFAILIPLVYLCPKHQSAEYVFTTFYNGGGWSTQGLALMVGSLTAMTSMPGVDAADHIAEEIKDAPRVIPLSMLISNAFGGALGFSMLIAILFCMPDDINQVLNATTFYPFMSIYKYAVGSTGGATAMASIIVVAQIFSTVSLLATASRMLWAFAREDGLPFSKYIARVDPKTQLPLYAIGVTAAINFLLALINIGSSVGFGAFLSLLVAAYYLSFVLSATVMLHYRLTHSPSKIRWGWFRLGRWGVPVTIIAIAYSIMGAFFSMFPTKPDPTIEQMNYCVLVFGGAILFSMAFWVFWGRKTYVGPRIEIDIVEGESE